MRRALTAAVLCLVPATAAMQERQPQRTPLPVPRAYAGIGAGGETTRSDFAQAVRFEVYGEDAVFEAAHDLPPVPAFTAEGGARLWRSLGIGVAVSHRRQRGEAAIHAEVAHPYFFGQRRTLDASWSGLGRRETAIHVGLLWMHAPTRNVLVDVVAGPAVIAVRQEVVTGIALAESYPYDEVGLSRAFTRERSDTGVGAHVAGSVFYRLARRWALGGGVRFSRATVDVETGRGQRVEIEGGGLQLTGGLRWLF